MCRRKNTVRVGRGRMGCLNAKKCPSGRRYLERRQRSPERRESGPLNDRPKSEIRRRPAPFLG
jgi:hypothetical protein